MKAKTFAALFLALIASPLICRADDAFIPPKFKGIILSAPGITNSANTSATALFRLTINPKTGTVTQVSVLKHGGGPNDNAAISTFLRWKFKPGSLKQLDVPVTFERDATILLKNAASQ